jgi:hypothetical protein
MFSKPRASDGHHRLQILSGKEKQQHKSPSSVQDGVSLRPNRVLTSLHSSLERTKTLRGPSQFIAARVPIVTGTLLGGMRVDISARGDDDTVADDGLAVMQACLDAQPHARPLLLALKAMLKQEGLNKVLSLCSASSTLSLKYIP